MEGMLDVPFWTRFCLIKPIATQLSANRPKSSESGPIYFRVAPSWLEDISLLLTMFLVIIPIVYLTISMVILSRKA